MQKIEVSIEFNDGQVQTVTVKPSVQVAFERHFGVGLPALGDELHMEHVYWMAWSTLRKSGDTPGDFDVWLDQVAGITTLSADEADPTTATPSPTPSAG